MTHGQTSKGHKKIKIEFTGNICYTDCITYLGGLKMLNLPIFPPHIRQAADQQKGRNWFVELLIFFLVFFISSTAMGFILIVGAVTLILADSSIMHQFTGGDVMQAEALMNSLMESDPLMLLMLFSNAVMILLTIYFCITLQKRNLSSMGFIKEKAGLHYLAGAGIGLLLFTAVTLINVLTGSMAIDGISENFSLVFFLLFAVGFAIQGMAEEVLCRGYFMVSIGRRYSVATAVFLNSLIFSLLHITNPGVSLTAVINILLFGVIMSLYFLRTGNIWGVGAMHSVWNFVQGNVFGMEVSGLNLSCTVFQSSIASHKEFWNGGAFGAEGGFSATIVLAAATLILLFWKQNSSVTVHENAVFAPDTGNGADTRSI